MKNTPFVKTVQLLKELGYKVKVEKRDNYRFAKVDGKGISGGFCNEAYSDYYSMYLKNRFTFDHEPYFDKWSRCPVSLPLPKTETQVKFLLDALKYMSDPKDEVTIKNYPK